MDRMNMKKKGKRPVLTLFAVLVIGMLSGCSMLSEEKIKLRDLDFTILSEDLISEELKAIIDEKQAASPTEPFQFTYSDKDNLYICIGYGQQATGGYSIAVNELYLTDSSICVNTSLLGPDASEKGNKIPSYPMIVIKTEKLEEPVVFE